jgi:hypothetical protein
LTDRKQESRWLASRIPVVQALEPSMIGIVIARHNEEVWIELCLSGGRARLCRSAWTVPPRGRADAAPVTRELGEFADGSIEPVTRRLQALAPSAA